MELEENGFNLDTEFYFLVPDGHNVGWEEPITQLKTHEKVKNCSLAQSFLMKKENFPCYVFRYPKYPLKMYDLETMMRTYVLIDKFSPLRIRVLNDAFIMLIKGPYFVTKNRVMKGGMLFDDFKKYLNDNW